jgi:hypothetical protein
MRPSEEKMECYLILSGWHQVHTNAGTYWEKSDDWWFIEVEDAYFFQKRLNESNDDQ